MEQTLRAIEVVIDCLFIGYILGLFVYFWDQMIRIPSLCYWLLIDSMLSILMLFYIYVCQIMTIESEILANIYTLAHIQFLS